MYIYASVRKPYYVFILDITFEAHSNGLFNQALQAISLSLDSIPYQEDTKIWILTVSEYVQWYRVIDTSKPPSVYKICDDIDSFIPFPTESLMLSLVSDRDKIDYLIQQLSDLDTHEKSDHNLCLWSAFKVSYDMLECLGGKVVLFYSQAENYGHFRYDWNSVINNLPSSELGANFKPSSLTYSELGKNFHSNSITVDIFLMIK